jgi:hypothetical protein
MHEPTGFGLLRRSRVVGVRGAANARDQRPCFFARSSACCRQGLSFSLRAVPRLHVA